MKETLVDQIINGSSNINKMRKKIADVVSMTVGYAKLTNKFSLRALVFGDAFYSENCVWRFRVDFESPYAGDYKIEIDCLIRGAHSESNPVGYTNTNKFSLKGEDVQIVYEDLQTFLDGMIKTFPDIANQWEYLIKASSVCVLA